LVNQRDTLLELWLNKKKSKFFENDNKENNTFKIERLALKEECHDVPMIFRVAEEYQKTIFVTEDFIELVKKHDLKGFRFDIDTSYEYDGPSIFVG